MKLRALYIRFYKSFNFDYLRKNHENGIAYPWEYIDNMWYPYVEIPIDPEVTTVVGANESGKTHLLEAIEKGLLGKGINRNDFCRYSRFFTVEEGEIKLPSVGFEWRDISQEEKNNLRDAFNLPHAAFEKIFLFILDGSNWVAYLGSEKSAKPYTVQQDKEVVDLLPFPHRIKPEKKLPQSVPLGYLVDEVYDKDDFYQMSRPRRIDSLNSFKSVLHNPEWFTSDKAVKENSNVISSTMTNILASGGAPRHLSEGLELAKDLLFKVAKIDKASIKELIDSIRDENEGHVSALVAQINANLNKWLNLSRWWTQDKDVKITVSPRDYDLVFTISDRTGSEYSFAERSNGLQTFLSYFIQYSAFVATSGRGDIVLMDEPDASLSGQAQQDLLNILQAYAQPESDKRDPVQVVYVTHSPFLIDKNRGSRIRVLEKGNDEEGTRVVNNAAKNHYEPLRSALGAFVAETAFIGNCNLMVEGLADQVLLASVSRFLRKEGASEAETLDLNNLTIVPAGSSSQIPYLVYLATGRDVVRPAIIALLDSDAAGDNAAKELQKGGPRRNQLLKSDLVIQVGNIGGLNLAIAAARELEDLLPLSLLFDSICEYAKGYADLSPEIVATFSESQLGAFVQKEGSLFDGACKYANSLGDNSFHIDKVGLARSVVDVFETWQQMPEKSERITLASGIFLNNFRELFLSLLSAQQLAMFELQQDKLSKKLRRIYRAFSTDHPEGARKDQVKKMLQEMEFSLDSTRESNIVRLKIENLKSEYRLNTDLTKQLEGYPLFLEQLSKLVYAPLAAVQVPPEELPSVQEAVALIAESSSEGIAVNAAVPS